MHKYFIFCYLESQPWLLTLKVHPTASHCCHCGSFLPLEVCLWWGEVTSRWLLRNNYFPEYRLDPWKCLDPCHAKWRIAPRIAATTHGFFLTHQTLYPVEVWLASVWFPRVLSCCWPDSLSFSTIRLFILGIRYQATVSAEALGDRVKFSEWRSPWSSSFQDCIEEDPLASAIVVGSENPHHANSFRQRTFFFWPLPFKPHSILGIGSKDHKTTWKSSL